MKITKSQFLTGLFFTFVCLFIIGVLLKLETLSIYSRAIILPFLVYLYYTESSNRSGYFALFLISGSIGEFLKIRMNLDLSIVSKVGNIAYIFGYLNLLVYIAKSINFKTLILKFKISIIVLVVFNFYLIFTLNQMILADASIEVFTFNFLIECTYNICILLVLSFSLINYLYHDSRRGLVLFLASVCIVFSEMLQVAYLFVSSYYLINIAYSLLLSAGFYLVYFYIVSKTNKFYKVLF